MSTTSSFAFRRPEKLVKSAQDVKVWEKSDAYAEYLGFVQAVGDAIEGKKTGDPELESSSSEPARRLVDMLDTLSLWADEVEPAEQQQRFGNKAFRTWYQRLEEGVDKLLSPVLEPGGRMDASSELGQYLLDSFGNPTRIDYGTGHEMAFVMLLCALFKIGVLSSGDDKTDDRLSVGLLVFPRYMEVARKLQLRYRMEPAGSQGVWNLVSWRPVESVCPDVFRENSQNMTQNARKKCASLKCQLFIAFLNVSRISLLVEFFKTMREKGSKCATFAKKHIWSLRCEEYFLWDGNSRNVGISFLTVL